MGGATKPLLILAEDNAGLLCPVVLKLARPGDGTAHRGPTSLALELIAATIGIELGLEIPTPFLVDVSSEFASVVLDPEVRRLLEENIGVHFGSAYIEAARRWNPGGEAKMSTPLGSIERVLAFDFALNNEDRSAYNPNLLVQGDTVVPIDHSLAIFGRERLGEEIEDSPVMGAWLATAHAVYPQVRARKGDCDGLLNDWGAKITDGFLDELRGILPVEWETVPGDLTAMFSFLKERSARLPEIRELLQRVVIA